MEIAIFDTSIWVDLYRNNITLKVTLLENYIEFYPNKIFLTLTIIQEILQGCKTISEFEYRKSVLSDFNFFEDHWLETSTSVARLYFDLRKKGVTIRKSTDCLIAQVAIQNDVLLVHNDSDFELMAQNSTLRTFK